MQIRFLVFTASLVLASTTAFGGPPPLDGAGVTFEDPLLDHLVGTWAVSGTIVGRPVQHRVTADWVLGHQFLRIHETSIVMANGKPDYEANPMIGYDHASERYVEHWIDVFGGRFSETLGYGTRSGDAIELVFEYPDGPFHSVLAWDSARAQWHWTMRQRDAAGKWSSFADLTLTKARQ
jgi:hypothetical protein